jgi:hypothetical protein
LKLCGPRRLFGRGESARVSSPADPVSIPSCSRLARAHAMRARRAVNVQLSERRRAKGSARANSATRPARLRPGPSACVTRPIGKASLTEPRAPTLASATRQTRHTYPTGTGSSSFDGGRGRRTANGRRQTHPRFRLSQPSPRNSAMSDTHRSFQGELEPQTIERARETRQGLTYCHVVIRPRMASVRTYRRPD